MGKLKVLNSTKEQIYEFTVKVAVVYENEIKGIKQDLDAYFYGLEDYILDVKNVKARLINYRDHLEMEEQKRKDELELARLKQSNANNSNSININITLAQVIESIN